MKVLVTEDMMNEREALDVWIEETSDISFDLSETGGYVEIGSISGRLVVEYEINHGKVRDQLEAARNPGIKKKINMFFENWGLNRQDTNQLDIEYGSLLFRGAEPIEKVPNQVDLTANVPTKDFEQTSPEDLKRQLRQELSYTVEYEDLENDIREYLQREGIKADSIEMGAPVHLQARAEPIAERADDPGNDLGRDLFGTEFTISVENKVPRRIEPSTLQVSMRPKVGREVVLLGQTSGSYNPAEESFEFQIPEVSAAHGKNIRTYELSFVVPRSAGVDLERIEGSAVLNTSRPFTDYLPEAVFDAGGHKLYDRTNGANARYANVDWSCSIQADFSTPTSDIMVGEGADITKKVEIDGVAPPDAETKIESVLRQRGIDSSGGVRKAGTELREEAEVTKFEGSYEGGSVVVDDTRIDIEITVSGERRTGEAGAERSGGEELPAKRRSVSMDYGYTGLAIRGRGADTQKVDTYLGDLRDELRLSLETLAEEV